VKLSILDLAHVPVGSDVSQALRSTLDLARHVDGLGFTRFWLAEHHNMPGIASAATAVVIGHVAAAPRPSAWARAASCCPTTPRW
jgi:alkanesulfonate monooxygenase SsuD/methylene tetrahydromethanopterin reductase-like flavin-dependent oxidoreductase (luciferase family)